ncbi:MAG: HIT family protein [Candidatus Nanoarchaeia archaeon]|nr:HIT family protein [Candidatus Nanoarchaeia archaeon]
MSSECVFCRIIKGEIPCAKLYENNDIIAFLDIMPAVKKGGHTLVVPKKHYEFITDMPDELIAKAMSAAKRIACAVMKEADGVNILLNNGKAAGQYVPHVHFHIVPRYKGDKIGLAHWEALKYRKGEMEKVQERIKKLFEEGIC